MSQVFRIDEAVADPQLLGGVLGDIATWDTWQATLKAAFGIDLTPAETELFSSIAGGRKPPSKRVQQLWAIVGRRGGKSRMAALVSAFLATCVDHTAYLAPGETGHVLCLAPTQSQAYGVLNYCRAMLEASPILRKQIEAVTAGEIRLKGNIAISVHSANYRTVRGRTLLAAILDETALWRSEESSLPDVEAFRALLPALMTTRGMIVGISTPYSQRGLLFERFRDYFGKDDDDVLVVKGSTARFNPLADTIWINKQLADDPEANKAEFLAEFRGDWSAYVDRETVARCVQLDVRELPFATGPRYAAFLDPSGGQHDSMTLGIAHRHGERVLLDAALEWKAPFDPAEVVTDVARVLRSYKIRQVVSDRYAGAWVEAELRKHDIWFKASERDKSTIFLDALPLMTSGNAMLLDNPRLVSQITGLQREVGKMGRDRIVKMRGAYDDLANAALGALVEVAAKRGALGADPNDLYFGRPEPKALLGYAHTKSPGRGIPTRPRPRPASAAELYTLPLEKIMVGAGGHFIRAHGCPANDGRQKFAVCKDDGSPEGRVLTFAWGLDEAKAAALNIANGESVEA